MQIAANLSNPENMIAPLVTELLKVLGTDRYMWDNRDCLSVSISLGGHISVLSTVALIKAATNPKIVLGPQSLFEIAQNGDPSIWHSPKIRLRTLATVAGDRALKSLRTRPELAQALFQIALAATIALAGLSRSYHRSQLFDQTGETHLHLYKAVLSVAIRFQEQMALRSGYRLGTDRAGFEKAYRDVKRTLADFRMARRLARQASLAASVMRRVAI